MKKYNKPTLNIEELSTFDVITTSTTVTMGANTQSGDKSVSFGNFGTGEWN